MRRHDPDWGTGRLRVLRPLKKHSHADSHGSTHTVPPVASSAWLDLPCSEVPGQAREGTRRLPPLPSSLLRQEHTPLPSTLYCAAVTVEESEKEGAVLEGQGRAPPQRKPTFIGGPTRAGSPRSDQIRCLFPRDDMTRETGHSPWGAA